MRVEITRCKRNSGAYVFCHRDDVWFTLYESDIKQMFTGEELDVLIRTTEHGIIEAEVAVYPDVTTMQMRFTIHLLTKRLSCKHMVGKYETGTACGCWICPTCDARGVCNVMNIS